MKQLTRAEKITLLREAAQGGVPTTKIDIKSKGYSIRRLLAGGGNKPEKIDEMYENLLRFRNNGNSKNSIIPEQKPNSLEQKILQQDALIASLQTRLLTLEKILQQIQTPVKEEKKKPGKKVLGIPVTQKTDVVGGRKYLRWYGYTKKNGKRRWIYIGKDFSQAQTKIETFLQKEKANANAPISSPACA